MTDNITALRPKDRTATVRQRRHRDRKRKATPSAAWITVDDTGARHQAANGFCTQIGNAYFAWFGTTSSKNRGLLGMLRPKQAWSVKKLSILLCCRTPLLAPVADTISVQIGASGDGAFLMKSRMLIVEREMAVPNLKHFALSNRCYGSTNEIAPAAFRSTSTLFDRSIKAGPSSGAASRISAFSNFSNTSQPFAVQQF
jgi:hypothetical protein